MVINVSFSVVFLAVFNCGMSVFESIDICIASSVFGPSTPVQIHQVFPMCDGIFKSHSDLIHLTNSGYTTPICLVVTERIRKKIDVIKSA